jgi:hypothetical protein
MLIRVLGRCTGKPEARGVKEPRLSSRIHKMGIAPKRDSEGYVQTKERSEVGEPHCALGPI